MVNGGTVNHWICINFSCNLQDSVANGFCHELAQMCNNSGMVFNPEAVLPPYSARPDQVEGALKARYHDTMAILQPQGKKLDLLIAILPDNNGSLYDDLKRICETDLGLVSHCCLTKNVYRMDKEYLVNVALKISFKVGRRNTVHVNHPQPGEEDSSPSIAARMVNGGAVNHWICINFSHTVQDSVAHGFCQELAQTCRISGMEFNPEAVLPPYSAHPDQVEQAVKVLYHDAMAILQPQGKKLDLLIVILPGDNGSLWGGLKRICRADLGLVSQCCLTKHVFSTTKVYLANVAFKINLKVGGSNAVLVDALSRRIPLVSDQPSGWEDASPSIVPEMINGGMTIQWTCINFSRNVQYIAARGFCYKLAQVCHISGMALNLDPVLPPYNGRPDQVETALKARYHDAMTILQPQGKKLDLLIAILPDNNGSLYGDLKRICEIDLGLVSQCCLAKHVHMMSNQYLENVARKINAKVGGRNTLVDALSRRVPLVSDIFGADATHPHPSCVF